MSRVKSVIIQSSVWLVLVGGSIFAALAIFEWMMQQSRAGTVAMRVAPASYGIVDEAPIKLFIMGINAWRDEWEWPLARTQWRSRAAKSRHSSHSEAGSRRASRHVTHAYGTSRQASRTRVQAL